MISHNLISKRLLEHGLKLNNKCTEVEAEVALPGVLLLLLVMVLPLNIVLVLFFFGKMG